MLLLLEHLPFACGFCVLGFHLCAFWVLLVTAVVGA